MIRKHCIYSTLVKMICSKQKKFIKTKNTVNQKKNIGTKNKT